MTKSWLKLLSVLVAVTAVLTPTLQKDDVEAQTAVDPRFGAVESFWAANEAADLGVGWERILFYWNEIQPTGPGDWNTLHVLEEWLTEGNAQGRTIVGLLKNTPVWATDGEFAAGVPRGLYLPIDDPGNLWANYARQIAAYYGPRGVHHWIIWNEPDIAPDVYGHEFSGSTEDYYRLVKVAYQVMKQVDPSATIHLGGMTYWHDPGYLRRYLNVVVADPEAAANNYFFDVISLHIYFRPETMGTIIGNAFAAQSAAGISSLKAVWVNETNARPSTDPEWTVEVQAFPLDLEQQAWYIPQAFALGFYAGAGRMAVYKLVDINIAPGEESWGLIRPYDFSKRPAYFAYQNTIKYLAGFTYPVRREMGANYYIMTFSRPQGVTRLLWARTPAAVTLRVPALAESAQLVNVKGEIVEAVPVNGVYSITLDGARCDGECLIGGPPLFLVENGVTAEQVPTAAPLPPPTVTPGATITPTATMPPTATRAPTMTPSPLPTDTPSPTDTLEPTATITVMVTTVMNTAVSPPTLTEPATAQPVLVTPIPAFVPISVPFMAQASWWLIGLGIFIAVLLVLGIRLRR